MTQQIVLKSKNELTDSFLLPDYNYYVNRVHDDGGVIINPASVANAFDFMASASISDSEVFSATNPNWGVKLNSSGNIAKLYNLFDSTGDLIPGAYPVAHDSASYQFPTSYLSGSASVYLQSVGIADNAESVTTASVLAVPRLSSYGSAATTSFPVSLLIDIEGLLNSSNGLLADYVLSSDALRRDATSNINPETWWYLLTAYGSSGLISTTDKYEDFNSIVKHCDHEGLTAFKAGTNIGFDASVTQKQTQKKGKLFLGHSFAANGSDATNYGLFNLAENWVLINAKKSSAAALSSYIASVY